MCSFASLICGRWPTKWLVLPFPFPNKVIAYRRYHLDGFVGIYCMSALSDCFVSVLEVELELEPGGFLTSRPINNTTRTSRTSHKHPGLTLYSFIFNLGTRSTSAFFLTYSPVRSFRFTFASNCKAKKECKKEIPLYANNEWNQKRVSAFTNKVWHVLMFCLSICLSSGEWIRYTIPLPSPLQHILARRSHSFSPVLTAYSCFTSTSRRKCNASQHT